MTQAAVKTGPRQPIAPQLRVAIWRRDQGACRYCGARGAMHLDHVQPWSQGGPDSYRNLVLACEPCNLAKGSDVWVPLPVGKHINAARKSEKRRQRAREQRQREMRQLGPEARQLLQRNDEERRLRNRLATIPNESRLRRLNGL